MNPKWTGLGLKAGIHVERPAIKRVTHGMVLGVFSVFGSIWRGRNNPVQQPDVWLFDQSVFFEKLLHWLCKSENVNGVSNEKAYCTSAEADA
jgi:hypothetical protein